MNVMRLYGKIGEHEGIVFVKNILGSAFWVVKLDPLNPNDPTKSTLVKQIKC